VIEDPKAIIAPQPIVGAPMPPPEVAIESPLPATLPPDRPTAVFLQGRAVGVRRLEILVDGVAHAPLASRMPRSDLGARGGWWAVVPLPGRAAGEAIEVAARADGAVLGLGRIGVEAIAPVRPAGRAIAVCMATYEPDPALFARQVESLREQTETDWVCVISDDCSSPAAVEAMREVLGDDARFRFSRAPSRQVFYRNFERALTLAPPDATLVALADQDDVWYPDKLATLRAALGDAPLAYSDQRLVTEDGALVRDSLWARRRPNHTDMTSLLVAGGVTGAAMLMRREVADRAVPFPDTPGMDFHDHWLALVALAHGDIAFVGRPLYDYVQHREAVFGRRDEPIPEAMRHLRTRWRAAYFGGYLQRVVFAEALLARCGDVLSAPRRGALRRYVRAQRSPLGAAWLALRSLRRLAGRTETVGSEGDLAAGLLWRSVARLGRDTRSPDAWTFQQKRLRRWRWSDGRR
jgi:glycosyltransferase involved in cell wall biosynthesis